MTGGGRVIDTRSSGGRGGGGSGGSIIRSVYLRTFGACFGPPSCRAGSFGLSNWRCAGAGKRSWLTRRIPSYWKARLAHSALGG